MCVVLTVRLEGWCFSIPPSVTTEDTHAVLVEDPRLLIKCQDSMGLSLTFLLRHCHQEYSSLNGQRKFLSLDRVTYSSGCVQIHYVAEDDPELLWSCLYFISKR